MMIILGWIIIGLGIMSLSISIILMGMAVDSPWLRPLLTGVCLLLGGMAVLARADMLEPVRKPVKKHPSGRFYAGDYALAFRFREGGWLELAVQSNTGSDDEEEWEDLAVRTFVTPVSTRVEHSIQEWLFAYACRIECDREVADRLSGQLVDFLYQLKNQTVEKTESPPG